SEPVMKQIIELQLKKIADRMKQNHKATFEYSPEVVSTIVARCKEVESGARNVDHILTGTLLPTISKEVLSRLAEGRPVWRGGGGAGGAGGVFGRWAWGVRAPRLCAGGGGAV